KTTGFRVLNTFLIAGFGIPKAVAAYEGKSAIPTTLDWIAGVACTIVLYWVGQLESTDPPVWPWLFHIDLLA
ncbi:hypothetical protein FA95DRAFT_1474016, partial [Auriscalpium vulgare]